jgi:hypothetical protein
MEPLQVTWRNEVVGRIEDVIPDMWLLEGRFIAASSPVAREFCKRASTLDARAVLEDMTKGIRAAIAANESGLRTVVVILSLSQDQLFLRMSPNDCAYQI